MSFGVPACHNRWNVVRSPCLPTLFLAIALCGGGTRSATAAPAFQDVTQSAGLDFVGIYGSTFEGLSTAQYYLQRNLGNGAAVGDYDDDGDLDVYLLGQLDQSNALYRNDLDLGLKSFTDVTSEAGVGNLGLSRVAHFVDLDNDGHLDLVLLNDDDGSGSYPSSTIYRNNGDGTFTDVTAGSNFAPVGLIRCGMAIADYDQDGLLDIYVTNWSQELGSGHPGFPYGNLLYRNLGNFVFQDVTTSSGLGSLARDSFSAIFADFNDDLFPDIYVAIDHTADEFYWNNSGVFGSGAGTFANHVGNDMGAACADFDDDGDLDIYTTNITDPDGRFGPGLYNCLYLNLDKSPDPKPPPLGFTRFEDAAVARGVEDTYWGWGVEFIDVENDSDLDIAAVTGYDEVVLGFGGETSAVYQTPTVLFVNDSNGYFTRNLAPGLEPAYDSRALIAFDYDRDGDEDLLITNVDQPVRLLENVTAPQGHWLDVQLVQGPGKNRNAIGASVYATVGSVTKRRDIICGDSYLAGTPPEAHFGLGPLTLLEELRVRWTDGTESIFESIQVDRLIRISNVPGDCNAAAALGDDDGDGVDECGDSCPGTPSGEQVDVNGCSCSQLDDDGDGVDDCDDQCPGTPSGEQAGADGCSCSQLDDAAPEITNCPETLTIPLDANCQFTAPQFSAEVEVADNCTATEDLVFTTDPDTFDSLVLGENQVVVHVTDESGKSSSCTVTVVIEVGDCTDPVPDSVPDSVPDLLLVPDPDCGDGLCATGAGGALPLMVFGLFGMKRQKRRASYQLLRPYGNAAAAGHRTRSTGSESFPRTAPFSGRDGGGISS